jgi:hypothetical protein
VFDEIIGVASYQHGEAVKWNQTAVEKITEDLLGLGRPYKYCGKFYSMEEILISIFSLLHCYANWTWSWVERCFSLFLGQDC